METNGTNSNFVLEDVTKLQCMLRCRRPEESVVKFCYEFELILAPKKVQLKNSSLTPKKNLFTLSSLLEVPGLRSISELKILVYVTDGL